MHLRPFSQSFASAATHITTSCSRTTCLWRILIPTPPPPPLALYHSTAHPPHPDTLPFPNTTERLILSCALAHVPEHGFSHASLARGAHDAGYPAISTSVLPEGGVFRLIRWHIVTQREGLRERWISSSSQGGEAAAKGSATPGSGGDGDPARIRRRTEEVMWMRLLGNKDVIGRWQEALAVMAQPSYFPASLRELILLADEILYLAGDTDASASWYTKRATVSAIYSAAELFMTSDTSPGFRETSAFVQRRFAEASGLGGMVGALAEWLVFTGGATVNLLRSKGLRI